MVSVGSGALWASRFVLPNANGKLAAAKHPADGLSFQTFQASHKGKCAHGNKDIAIAIQNAGFLMIWKLSANRAVSDFESLLQRLRKKSLIVEVNILASGK